MSVLVVWTEIPYFVVDSLDLKKLGFQHAEPRGDGRPPYDPADMLKL